MQSYRLYAGAYTDGKPGDGVYFLDFDADGLRAAQVCGGVVNTSYVLPESGRLYAVVPALGGARLRPVPHRFEWAVSVCFRLCGRHADRPEKIGRGRVQLSAA